MLSKQQIFDKVAVHLLKQGKQSRSSAGCLYRGPDGTKCAVGVLIPDSYYRDWMDNYGEIVSVTEELENRDQLDSFIKGTGLNLNDPQVLSFLGELQELHDDNRVYSGYSCHFRDCAVDELWPEKLVEFAIEHNLDTSALEGLV